MTAGTAAVADDADVTEEDPDLRDVEAFQTGAADGGEDAPPVRVAGEQRGLDQWRMGDGVGDPQAFLARCALGDLHRHELGRPLAVAHDRLGEFRAELGQRGRESLKRAVVIGDGGTRYAGGHEHAAVVGRRVAVDGDAVEGDVHRLHESTLKQRLGHGSVGRDETQHGRHVRPDHARPLGDAGQRDLGAVDIDSSRCPLRHGVRSHDAVRRLDPAVGAQRRQRIRQARLDPVHRQGFADDARGKRQHLLGPASGERRQFGAAAPRVVQTGVARAGIGIARVDQQIARVAGAQVFARDLDRCGAEGVAGEHRRHGAARGDLHDDQIAATGLLDAGTGDAQTDAIDRGEISGSVESDRHGL